MIHKKGDDFLSEMTLSFIREHLNPEGLRILEVGCATGAFAMALEKAGAQVVGIDTDKDAVESARKKGIEVHHEDILSFNDKSFDAIIFTRSLHHIHRLQDALTQVRSLLKPEGKLLIEDFDLLNIDFRTTRWYYDILVLFSESDFTEQEFGYIEDPVNRWRDDHHHDPPINSGSEMLEGTGTLFRIIHAGRNPYLYRSIHSALLNEKSSYSLIKKIWTIETGLIRNQLILPNGLRIVAEK